MKSPLVLVEVSQHNTKTGEITYEWVVVRTASAARGISGRRAVFVRHPTSDEALAVEAALEYSVEPGRKVFNMLDMLGTVAVRTSVPHIKNPRILNLAKILRGES